MSLRHRSWSYHAHVSQRNKLTPAAKPLSTADTAADTLGALLLEQGRGFRQAPTMGAYGYSDDVNMF